MTASDAVLVEPAKTETPLNRGLTLEWVPRLLASVGSRYIFVALFLYLVVLPVTHLYTPTSNAMLIGGNYTNVTGALGACIASAVGLSIQRGLKKRHLEQQLHEWLVREHLGIPHPAGTQGHGSG